MKGRRHHIYIVLFCLYILAVGVVCFARPDEIPQLPLDWFGLSSDKIAHFLMFIPFPILAWLTFVPERLSKSCKSLSLIAISVIGAVIAAATEQIQGALGYRLYEIKDLFADFIGIAVGAIAILAYIALKTERK
jgi:VanZ family protein